VDEALSHQPDEQRLTAMQVCHEHSVTPADNRARAGTHRAPGVDGLAPSTVEQAAAQEDRHRAMSKRS